MAKFLLGIAIVAFTTFCGYMLGKKRREKKEFFIQFALFNERFLHEISYARRPLQEFFSKYTYKKSFLRLLERFSWCINERLTIKENLLTENEFGFLNKEEKNVVEDYFLMLGKGDSISQKNYFSSAKDSVSTLEKEAVEACKKYGDLYIKLGFLCGLLILILIL